MSELGSSAPLAFAAGLLSVLSPCVLPLMPAYLSLISGITVEEMQAGAGDTLLRRRVMAAAAAFVLGFSLVFVVLGVGAFSVGRVVRTWGFDVLFQILAASATCIFLAAALLPRALPQLAAARATAS